MPDALATADLPPETPADVVAGQEAAAASPPVLVRPATLRDLPALRAHFSALWQEMTVPGGVTWSREDLDRLTGDLAEGLTNPAIGIWVAVDETGFDPEPVGFFMVEVCTRRYGTPSSYLHVVAHYVVPVWRGRGVSRALIVACGCFLRDLETHGIGIPVTMEWETPTHLRKDAMERWIGETTPVYMTYRLDMPAAMVRLLPPSDTLPRDTAPTTAEET